MHFVSDWTQALFNKGGRKGQNSCFREPMNIISTNIGRKSHQLSFMQNLKILLQWIKRGRYSSREYLGVAGHEASNCWYNWSRRFCGPQRGVEVHVHESGTLPEHPGWLGPVVLYDPSLLSRGRRDLPMQWSSLLFSQEVFWQCDWSLSWVSGPPFWAQGSLPGRLRSLLSTAPSLFVPAALLQSCWRNVWRWEFWVPVVWERWLGFRQAAWCWKWPGTAFFP